MKTSPYMAAIRIIFAGLFFVTTGQAETPECNSAKVVELIASNTKSADCPPVLVCKKGYVPGCIKDDIIIPPPAGEQQQYPSEAAENWIQSVVSGTLVDIATDDPRWGNRDVGEVFARENNDFIIWYWPKGGAATFDPTKLGTPAKWYDYRLSRPGGEPRGGSLNLSAGMNIHFNDSGNGGISIFARADDTKPPSVGGCAEFLTEYTNPKQSRLPAHRVYPMGQKMMITAWLGRSDSDLSKLKNNGFTMQGPHWDTRPSVNDSVMKKARSLGLRSAYRIVDGAGLVRDLIPLMDNGVKEEKLYRSITGQLKRALNNPDYNDMIDIWLTGTEEISTRNSGNEAKLNRYLRNFKRIVQENDPQKRPLWMSDVTGVSKSSMMVTHKYLDMVGPQAYLGRIGKGGYKTDAVMGGIAQTIKSTALELDSRYPQIRPHAATASLDLYYEPVPARASAEMLNKITEHWMYLGLNNGLQGFQLYAWYPYETMTATTRQRMQAAYLKHVKRLTDNKLDYVYLWGDRRKDLGMKILSGPTTTHGYPSISMQNIQYGNNRYVILTNSADEPVRVEVSGFPSDCLNLLNMRTKKILSLDASVSLSIEPLGIRMYKVSK